MLEDSARNTLSISCMFLWIILAALCFSSVYDGLGAVKAIENLLLKRWDLGPWTILILMLLSFIIMGAFLDDTAMLVIVAPLYIPLVDQARLQSDLVRHPLYDHLPDRLHHAALRLQSVPDARDGAARDHADRHLPVHRSVLLPDGAFLIILMIFPQIALWLPELYAGR